MGYSLGVDLGTTYTAAAVGRDGVVTMAALGARSPEIPTVVVVGADGPVVGEAAERRSVTEPHLVAREFKRRVGDPVPLVVAGDAWSAESLMAMVLRDVIDRVSEREKGPPEDLVVTVPASWKEYKLAKVDGLLAEMGWPDARRLSEPEAAARWYLAQDKLDAGSVVAVFDFGGGTFDSAVLRHQGGDRFERLGEAMGIERLGGVDLDEAVFQRVLVDAGIDMAELRDDPQNRSSLARLRADCTAAKEALSADTSATIVVVVPGHLCELRLTRQEFESMIRPAIGDAIGAMDATIASAGLDPGQLDAVLLVGGSSRIPLVAQMVSAHFDCPTLVDTHPKHTIASGAALSMPGRADELSAALEPGVDLESPLDAAPLDAAPLDAAPLDETVEPGDSASPGWRTPRVFAIAVAVVIALASAIALLARGGDDEISAEGVDTTEPPPRIDADDSILGEESRLSGPTSRAGGDFTLLLGTDSRSEAPVGIATHELGFAGEGPPADPSLLWTLQPDSGLWSSVVGGGGLVFLLEERSVGQTLVAYDGETGIETWAAPVPWASEIFIAGPTVMVSSLNGVEAFDQQTGQRFGFVGPVVDASPNTSVIRGPVALFSSSIDSPNGQMTQVRSIDLASNDVNWIYEEEFRYPLPLISFLADEATAIVGAHQEVVALDVDTGAELWRNDQLDGYDLELVAMGVVVVNLDGKMSGLDARTGAQVWTRSEFGFQLASDGETVFFINRRGELEAMSIDTGSTMWAVRLSPIVDSDNTVVVGNQTIYVLQGNEVVTAHRASTGELVWSGTLEGLSSDASGAMTVAVADERLIVVRHSKVHVFGVGDGAQSGSAATDGTGSRSPLASIIDPDAPVVSAHPSFTTGGRPFAEPGPIDQPSLLWQLSRSEDRAPAIAAGGLVLYVDSFPDADGVKQTHVVAADPATGVEQWATPIQGPVFELHAVGPNLVARIFNGLVGIEIASGEVIGVVPVGSPPLGRVLHVRDGSLILGWVESGTDNLVESIDLASGITNWTFLDDSSGTQARHLLVGDDTVILTFDASTVAIDLASGEELWRTLDFGGREVVLLTGDTLLVQVDFPNVAAVDARSGETRWVRGEEGAGARDDGSSFYDVQIASGRLVKVDLDDGTRQWSAATVPGSSGMPLISGDVAYVLDDDGVLVAHRTSDGGILWSAESGVDNKVGLWVAVGSDVIVLTDGARIAVIG